MLRSGTDGQSPPGPHLVLNVSEAMSRLGGDKELFRCVIKYFQEDAPPLMDELLAATAARDAQRIFKAAHGLHGLALNLGADEFAAETDKLEATSRERCLDGVNDRMEKIKRSYERLLHQLKKYPA